MALKTNFSKLLLIILFILTNYITIKYTTSLTFNSSILLENSLVVIISIFIIIVLTYVLLLMFKKVSKIIVLELILIFILSVLAIYFTYTLTLVNISFSLILSSQLVIGLNALDYDSLNFKILQYISLSALSLLFFAGMSSFIYMLFFCGILINLIIKEKVTTLNLSIIILILINLLFLFNQYI